VVSSTPVMRFVTGTVKKEKDEEEEEEEEEEEDEEDEGVEVDEVFRSVVGVLPEEAIG
jgi:hypothetical protein